MCGGERPIASLFRCTQLQAATKRGINLARGAAPIFGIAPVA
jgi:hypothetical protein